MSVAKCFTDFHIDMGSSTKRIEFSLRFVFFLFRRFVGLVSRGQRKKSVLAFAAKSVTFATVRRMDARPSTKFMFLCGSLWEKWLSNGHSRSWFNVFPAVGLDSRGLHARRFFGIRRKLFEFVSHCDANRNLEPRTKNSRKKFAKTFFEKTTFFSRFLGSGSISFSFIHRNDVVRRFLLRRSSNKSRKRRRQSVRKMIVINRFLLIDRRKEKKKKNSSAVKKNPKKRISFLFIWSEIKPDIFLSRFLVTRLLTIKKKTFNIQVKKIFFFFDFFCSTKKNLVEFCAEKKQNKASGTSS